MVINIESKKKFQELTLLFEARKVPYTFERKDDEWIVIIPDHDSERAAKEIYLYTKENINWPPAYKKIKEISHFTILVNSAAILALIVFHMKVDSDNNQFWLNQGKASSEKILSGEWQRVVTALTLHSDASHLMGNCAILFITLLGLGSFIAFGRSWFYIIFSGGLGNFISAVVYKSHHNSIGSSSAVFGAIGILGGVHLVAYRGTATPILRRFIPLFSAIALLALLGTGENSDLLGHFFGFLSGMAIGLTLTFFQKKDFQENRFIELFLLFLTIIFICYCWITQLAR